MIFKKYKKLYQEILEKYEKEHEEYLAMQRDLNNVSFDFELLQMSYKKEKDKVKDLKSQLKAKTSRIKKQKEYLGKATEVILNQQEKIKNK